MPVKAEYARIQADPARAENARVKRRVFDQKIKDDPLAYSALRARINTYRRSKYGGKSRPKLSVEAKAARKKEWERLREKTRPPRSYEDRCYKNACCRLGKKLGIKPKDVPANLVTATVLWALIKRQIRVSLTQTT